MFLGVPQCMLIISYALIVFTLLKKRHERQVTFAAADPTFTAMTNKVRFSIKF